MSYLSQIIALNLPFILRLMKKLFVLLLFCLGQVFMVKGQEIIPFPDLSENHIAVYNQVEIIEDHNYSLYPKEYRNALKQIDQEIEVVNNRIENESNKVQRTSLQSQKALLVKKRTGLLQEADLLEDLNKLY